MDISYQWLQSFFTDPLPAPAEVAEKLVTHSFEIEGVHTVGDDTIISVDVLPNRAHDCLSHEGIAREVAVLYKRSLVSNRYGDIPAITQEVSIPTVSLQTDAVRRYMAVQLADLSIDTIPSWMSARLAAIGQQQIHPIVDILNYVLFDCGQPLHAFDAKKVTGEIVVRHATDGEEITLLSGETVTLTPQMVVIADTEKPLALAGIKGGVAAAVTKETEHIIIESATFDPVRVRTTARTLGIQTDAAKRFENDISTHQAAVGLDRALRLLRACDKRFERGEIRDMVQTEETERSITVSHAHIEAVLGGAIPQEEVIDILDRFGWEYAAERDSYAITVPQVRKDLTRAEDIIEEIGRVYGYDAIPEAMPTIADTPTVSSRYVYEQRIRNTLVGCGYSEIITTTFRPDGESRVANPVGEDRPYLRTAIAPGMQESLTRNVRNKDVLGSDAIAVFEIGTVFSRTDEHLSLAIGWSQGKDKKGRWKEELTETLHALKETLGQSLEVTWYDNVVECNLTRLVEELPPASTYEFRQSSVQDVAYTPFSVYPHVVRDIAVWLPQETDATELETVLHTYAGEYLVRPPRCIDVFEKDGRISYAYRLVFQAPDRTLTDEEVNRVMEEIYARIAERGWEIR